MDTTNNTQDKTDITYLASEARFMYLREQINTALANGQTPDEAFTKFGDIPADEQQRWIDVATHLSNLVTEA